MEKKKMKLREVTDNDWFSLHEAAEFLKVTGKEVLELSIKLKLLRYTLFGTYTIFHTTQIDQMKKELKRL